MVPLPAMPRRSCTFELLWLTGQSTGTLAAARPTRLSPAEPRRRRRRRQRARRQPFGQHRLVVPRGGDVVRRVGVEQRGEVLDVPAAGAELELPAAVGADPPAAACV